MLYIPGFGEDLLDSRSQQIFWKFVGFKKEDVAVKRSPFSSSPFQWGTGTSTLVCRRNEGADSPTGLDLD